MTDDELIQEIPVTCLFFRDKDGKDMAELKQLTGSRATACTVVYSVAQRPDLTKEYPAEWAAYQANKPQDEAIDGTPLDEVPGLTAPKILELKAMGIKSADMLAGLNDQVLSALGAGSLELRENARTVLKAKHSDEKDDQIAALQQQIGELTQAMRGGQVGGAMPAQPQGGDLATAIAQGVAAALQGMNLAPQPAQEPAPEVPGGFAPQPTVAPEGASPAPSEAPQPQSEAPQPADDLDADLPGYRIERDTNVKVPKYELFDPAGEKIGQFRSFKQADAERQRLMGDAAA